MSKLDQDRCSTKFQLNAMKKITLQSIKTTAARTTAAAIAKQSKAKINVETEE